MEIKGMKIHGTKQRIENHLQSPEYPSGEYTFDTKEIDCDKFNPIY